MLNTVEPPILPSPHPAIQCRSKIGFIKVIYNVTLSTAVSEYYCLFASPESSSIGGSTVLLHLLLNAADITELTAERYFTPLVSQCVYVKHPILGDIFFTQFTDFKSREMSEIVYKTSYLPVCLHAP